MCILVNRPDTKGEGLSYNGEKFALFQTHSKI